MTLSLLDVAFSLLFSFKEVAILPLGISFSEAPASVSYLIVSSCFLEIGRA